ncbi:MAG: hypothetical protein QY328_14180 [Anaerolineales bacterium]|nr:MAG: hypothetical protein QY328_14180 [Anaerolineales bacterium]
MSFTVVKVWLPNRLADIAPRDLHGMPIPATKGTGPNRLAEITPRDLHGMSQPPRGHRPA